MFDFAESSNVLSANFPRIHFTLRKRSKQLFKWYLFMNSTEETLRKKLSIDGAYGWRTCAHFFPLSPFDRC